MPFVISPLNARLESAQRSSSMLLAGLAACVLLSGCGELTEAPNPADMVLHVVSGDSQVGVPFEELADPIVVQVIDTANKDYALLVLHVLRRLPYHGR